MTDFRPPTAPHKRGRTPERVLGLIRSSFRARPRAVWYRVDFGKIAEWLEISPRSVYRAKAYLMEHAEFYGLRFVTLRGSKSWECLVALEDRLKFDKLPLFFRADGSFRHLREWIQGEEFVATARGIAAAGSGPNSGDSDSDRCYYRATKTAECSINGGDPGPAGCEKAVGHWPEPPPERRERYCHALARRLGQCHWDNCKVRRCHTAIVAVVRHLIRDGIRPAHIIGAYDEAVHYMHGMATDKGLNKGDPRLMFTLGSSLRRTYLNLGYYECDTDRGKIFVRVHDLV